MKKTALVAIMALALWGCAPLSQDYRQGTQAELNQQYDKAIKYYEKAMLDHPGEGVYRLALVRAKSEASLVHLATARTLAKQGKKKEAGDEYAIALFYDPLNSGIAAEIKALMPPAPSEKAKVPQDVIAPPVNLKAASEKVNLSFRTPVMVRSIFDAMSRMFGVNFIYDDTFRDSNLAIDLSGKDVDQAISFLCVASHNFYRIIDEKTVLIAPDNYQKRQQYELVAIKTFYLSNINAQDVMNPLMQLIKSPNKLPVIQVDKTMNSIMIRDTPQVLALAGKLLRMWDKAKPEVVIDIEIMEVSRTKLRQLGIDFSGTTFGVRLTPTASTSSSDSGWIKLSDIKLNSLSSWQLTNSEIVLDLLESDSNSKIIAKPRIRGVAGEDIHYLVGQKVPIVNSSFQSVLAGGVNAQPVVQYQFQDIGIELKLKPRVHLENEVTLEAEIKISSIASTGIAGIPIINNREVKNVLRLKDGETNLLAGLLRDEERKSLGGISFLKDLPLLGRLFSTEQTVIDQSDVILTLTPHIVRTMLITGEDSKPTWVESDSFSGVAAGQRAGAEEATAVEAAQEEQPAQPGEQPGSSSVYISPASLEVPKDREFRMNVEVSAGTAIGNMSLNIGFNPQVLKLTDVLEGGLTGQMGGKSPFLKVVNPSGCTLGFSSPALGGGFKGQATLAVLVFTAVGPGESAVDIASVSALGSTGQSVSLNTGDARILVR